MLNAQLEATAPLFGEDMDVLLWPEGGIDSDPTHRRRRTAAVLDALAERIDAPLLVSAVTAARRRVLQLVAAVGGGRRQPGRRRTTSGIPCRSASTCPIAGSTACFAPDLIDLIQREYTPGTSSPVFDVDGVGVGLAICFDVIYDDVIWDGARDGAEVYMFQTNNADFRGTDENLQQLAFARMRAIETGRSVVNLSTVGTSQVIAPDGADDRRAARRRRRATCSPTCRCAPGSHRRSSPAPCIKIVLGWGSLVALAALGRDRLRVARGGNAKTPAPEGTGVSRERVSVRR